MLGLAGIYYMSALGNRPESKEVVGVRPDLAFALKNDGEGKGPRFLSRGGTWRARGRDL